MNVVEKIVTYIKKRNMQKKTFNELINLSDKELADIGISRCDILAISKEVF